MKTTPVMTEYIMARLLKGERATLVVRKENEAAARNIHAKLSPRLQALLTIQVEA